MSNPREKTHLCLPAIPKGEFYEDFVAAILSVCGLFVERRINLSEPVNILELDIVTTNFFVDHTEKTLAEIKSGQWGLTDVFKVRGWLDYLKYDNGIFVVLDDKKQLFDEYQVVANSLKIDLINVAKQDDDKLDVNDILNKFGSANIDERIRNCAVPTLRYAYCLERVMIEKCLGPLSKDYNGLEGARFLKDYIHRIRDYSFFFNEHDRLFYVFESFKENNHITARIDLEKREGFYDNKFTGRIDKKTFKELFYSIPFKENILHVALFAEMYNRLLMLKLVVEEILRGNGLQTLSRLSLPSNIQFGIDKISSESHFYLYPVLWQNFIFVMGGILLKDKLDEEYHILSVLSGVPENEIEKGLSAFDSLFPIEGGSWLFDKPRTSIKVLQFMPTPYCGIGANFRRIYYGKDGEEYGYDHLKSFLSGQYTVSDLEKYNRIAFKYLSKEKELKS